MSIPELGTVAGTQRPLIVLTSNATRELSEALRRRCLYLYIDYPDVERERAIVRARVPEVDELLATQIAQVVRSIRQLDLKKAPSISETIDWARTLLHLERRTLDPATVDTPAPLQDCVTQRGAELAGAGLERMGIEIDRERVATPIHRFTERWTTAWRHWSSSGAAAGSGSAPRPSGRDGRS